MRKLDFKAIGRLPESISLRRNRRPYTAELVKLGEIYVSEQSFRIADSAWIEEVPLLPIRIANGPYEVYAYQWNHSSGIVNVCAVLYFGVQEWCMPRRLKIRTDIRPDLTAGIIVDTAEIGILGDTLVTLNSGLGDGYYPVVANFNYGLYAQSVIVDFKIWDVRDNVGFPPEYSFDEYRMITRNLDDSSDG